MHKVVFDFRMAAWSGIGTYSTALVKEFCKKSLPFKIHLLVNHSDELVKKASRFGLPIIQTSAAVFSLPEQLLFPKLLRQEKCQLFHSPHFVFPIRGPFKKIITLHDLTPLIFPKYFPIQARIYMRFLIKQSIKKTAHIITISEHTKLDLLKRFSCPPEKISVIKNGFGQTFNKRDNSIRKSDLLKSFGINKNYFLYAGNLKPHKNIIPLIRAFSMIDSAHQLVLAGAGGAYEKEIRKVIKSLKLDKRVILTGFLENENLQLIYNSALSFIFPSLHEGFGLPPLEAMQTGLPVISSNSSSLPEVIGNAGLLINPQNIDALADAMRTIAENKKLRTELITKGYQQIKKFSWEKCADQVLLLYEKSLNTSD